MAPIKMLYKHKRFRIFFLRWAGRAGRSVAWESYDQGFTVCCVLLQKSIFSVYNTATGDNLYRVSQEECAKLRESVP